MRGLDGIQGPVYVGTGCVFNRTALYGYEPPLKPKKNRKPGLFSSCFGGSRKKSTKSSKKGSDKKKYGNHVDPTVPVFNLEDIEEGVEGMTHYNLRFLVVLCALMLDGYIFLKSTLMHMFYIFHPLPA